MCMHTYIHRYIDSVLDTHKYIRTYIHTYEVWLWHRLARNFEKKRKIWSNILPCLGAPRRSCSRRVSIGTLPSRSQKRALSPWTQTWNMLVGTETIGMSQDLFFDAEWSHVLSWLRPWLMKFQGHGRNVVRMASECVGSLYDTYIHTYTYTDKKNIR